MKNRCTRLPVRNSNTVRNDNKEWRNRVAFSCRSRGKGIEDFSGRFRTPHALRCLELRGVNIQKITDAYE